MSNVSKRDFGTHSTEVAEPLTRISRRKRGKRMTTKVPNQTLKVIIEKPQPEDMAKRVISFTKISST